MAELYWFPHFPQEFLNGPAASMLPEQEGAYRRLMDLAWGKGDVEPSLPADDAQLAQLSRLGARWKKLGGLIRSQFVERDGRLFSACMSDVWRDQQEKHAAAVSRASSGGKAKAERERARKAATGNSSGSATSSAASTTQALLQALPGARLERAELELEETVENPLQDSLLVSRADRALGVGAPRAPRGPTMYQPGRPGEVELEAREAKWREDNPGKALPLNFHLARVELREPPAESTERREPVGA